MLLYPRVGYDLGVDVDVDVVFLVFVIMNALMSFLLCVVCDFVFL